MRIKVEIKKQALLSCEWWCFPKIPALGRSEPESEGVTGTLRCTVEQSWLYDSQSQKRRGKRGRGGELGRLP